MLSVLLIIKQINELKNCILGLRIKYAIPYIEACHSNSNILNSQVFTANTRL